MFGRWNIEFELGFQSQWRGGIIFLTFPTFYFYWWCRKWVHASDWGGFIFIAPCIRIQVDSLRPPWKKNLL
jgi:hypothetical protein